MWGSVRGENYINHLSWLWITWCQSNKTSFGKCDNKLNTSKCINHIQTKPNETSLQNEERAALQSSSPRLLLLVVPNSSNCVYIEADQIEEIKLDIRGEQSSSRALWEKSGSGKQRQEVRRLDAGSQRVVLPWQLWCLADENNIAACSQHPQRCVCTQIYLFMWFRCIYCLRDYVYLNILLEQQCKQKLRILAKNDFCGSF